MHKPETDFTEKIKKPGTRSIIVSNFWKTRNPEQKKMTNFEFWKFENPKWFQLFSRFFISGYRIFPKLTHNALRYFKSQRAAREAMLEALKQYGGNGWRSGNLSMQIHGYHSNHGTMIVCEAAKLFIRLFRFSVSVYFLGILLSRILCPNASYFNKFSITLTFGLFFDHPFLASN